MGSLVLAIFTSVDGYIEGPDREFVPPAWSDDLARHWSGHSLARAGHLVYGRVSFEFNREFWSPADTDPTSPAASVPHAGTMNRLPKTVVSDRLQGDPGWNGTVVRGAALADEVRRLKAIEPRDVYCFGGAGIANSLVALDLVDEYRLMVVPTMYGDGKPLFGPGRPRLPLALLESRPLDTGAVILHYRRDRGRGAA
jgi:dihydrofolate reductase